VLEVLSTMGSTALTVLAILLGLFVLAKFIERRRFQKAMQTERISIDELKELLDAGHDPVMVDARSATAQMLEPPVPGALLVGSSDPLAVIQSLPKDRHIIVYCSCPNDVTAAKVAKQLHAHGYKRAKPLHGGLDAWNSAFRGESESAVVAEMTPDTLTPADSRH
jgi:rhodanese-related sulfurtransferase